MKLNSKKLMFTLFCTLIVLTCAVSAIAGNITFYFELQDKQCVISNKGDSTAYYPVVYELDSGGQWFPLKTSLNSSELLPGGTLSAELRTSTERLSNMPDIQDLRVVMIRFFDQAGVSFGQVAVLRSPPMSDHKIKAVYSGKHLKLSAPAGTHNITATWVIAPREEGITPALRPQSFAINQPPAIRIDWKKSTVAEIKTGVTLPSAMLVHETSKGFTLQVVEKGKVKKTEQRASWLNIKKPFYAMAIFCCIFGVLLALSVRRTDDCS